MISRIAAAFTPHASPTFQPRPARARRLTSITALAAAALISGACGGDKSTGPRSVAGVYTLQSVAGRGLPATIVDETVTDSVTGQQVRVVGVVTGGTVTLVQSGQYTAALGTTVSIAGQPASPQPVADAGTYAVSGTTITFTSTAGQGVTTGSISNGTITVSQDLVDGAPPMALVFRK